MALNNMLGCAVSPLSASFGGTFGLPGVYVSKMNGSDITGDGTMSKPYASFGYAITQVGTPSMGMTIFGMDSDTYDENLTISVANININAPLAKLIPTTGDALTLTFNAPIAIQFSTIATSVGARALYIPTFGNLFVKTNELYGKLQTGDGAIFIQTSLSYGEMATGGGLIYGFVGDSLLNPGPFSGNIRLMTPTGPYIGPSSSTFFAPVSLTINDYTLPTADGASGTFLTTDGAGVTSFASIPETFMSFDTTVTAAALASGGSVILFTAESTAQYKIRHMWINSNGTNFSGIGADRLINITDGTTSYSLIPSASLTSLINIMWGTPMTFPYPASNAMNTSTVASQNIIATYSGGTTDYSAGSVVISGIVERVG